MPLDPVIAYVISFAAGAILLVGAWDKWQDREIFAGIVEAYGLLPVPMTAVFAVGVMLAEGLIGVALFLPSWWPAAQVAAMLLLFIVTLGVAINLLRGRTELSCGCGGASGDQALSWWLVLRNGLFVALLALATLPRAPRALAVLDVGTIVLGSVLLFGLYTVGNQLLANAPRVASLKLS